MSLLLASVCHIQMSTLVFSAIKMHNLNLLFAGLLSVAGLAHAGDAASWFERMREAVHGQDYEGRFVYQVGDQLSAMYVVHRVAGLAELERLVSLNGDQKQVIRGARAVACLEPGKHRINVIEGMANLGNSNGPEIGRLQANYRFSLENKKRVAGRLARLVRVTPRDDLRYGYEIYLDEQTALPLRTVVRDHLGRLQSQMMFVELKTGHDITPIEHDVSALRMTARDRITVAAKALPPETSDWHFPRLPSGFELRHYRADGNRRHFILSDGLASLSLYVESLAGGEGLQGHSHVGATRAFGARRHGHQITAVGEVPGTTLQMIVDAIEPR